MKKNLVVGLGEIWRAPANPLNPYMRAVDSPEREEALVAELVTKNGSPVNFTATIKRDGENITLDETEILRDFAAFLFAPVYEAWGRKIPDQWLEMVGALDNSNGSP